jgi:hypothetical protein
VFGEGHEGRRGVQEAGGRDEVASPVSASAGEGLFDEYMKRTCGSSELTLDEMRRDLSLRGLLFPSLSLSDSVSPPPLR